MPKKTDLPLLLINSVEEPVFYLSSDFIILDLNAPAKKIFKITKNSIIGKPFSVLCSDHDLKSLEYPFDRNLKTRLRKKVILWDSLCLKKPINGVQFIAIGIIKNQTSKSALNSNLKRKTDDANPLDITSQFLTEQINDNNKNTSDYVNAIYRYMENIIAQIPVSVYWMNKDHVYMGCSNNMVKLLNLNSRYDIVGKTYEDLYHEKSTSYYKKADKAVMDKGISLSIEEPFYYPDGTEEIYLSNKVPLRDLEGKIIGMLGVSVDITDRKKMELELNKAKETAEAANKVKTEFIANMSHDLRTPLSGVVGMAELMKEQASDPVQVQYAEWIFDCSQQLLSLLDSILDIVSLGNVKEDELKITSFDINECIAELVHLEMPSIKLKQLDLIVNIDKKIPRLIKTDRIKLHRIILNLLGNAIKFTESGYIAVDVKLLELNNQAGLIYFAISDTGIGIPENQQSKIFDRFHRIIPSSIGKYKGHGVGLHIVQSYVNLLGGEIQVNSKPGVGTTFYFELPIQVGNENEVAKEHYKFEKKNITPVSKKEKILDKHSKNEFLHSSPNILILEDNLVARRTIESLATQEKCSFVSVAKGKEAIRLAKTNEFDLIITDIGLPDIEGHVVAKLIREWESSRSKQATPIIGLTAHVKEKSKEICLKSGMDDVFNKPISRQLLQYILNRFIPSKNKNSTSFSSQKTTSSEQIIEADLPENESNFFNLDAYPLLDIHNAVSIMGSLKLVREILPLMIGKETQKDVESIEKAFHIKDWETVERIAHKMKGGAANCGAVRMKYACQYLERYQKMGYTKLLEPLYQQLITVVKDTQKNIHEWLKHCPS
ncbi:TPA: response regulator [Legionella pneumophila]|nr:response regulator [Legionella pneumophila]